MTDYTPQSPFLQDAQARGFVYQCTDLEALDQAFLAGPVSAYIGFDPTADSLHVGSALQIMLLRLLQKHGHRPVALMGGGTAKIGDPSFRDEARALMDDATLAHNLAGVEASLRRFLTFGDAASDAILVNNADWLDALPYIALLREVGVHFSISRMLGFESVKQRLEREQGLTFLEFNYAILQSYDFRELHRRHGVTLQLGGSDQWGNIVSGIDLVRRTDQGRVFGLTAPLLTTASGAKMGKSASGAIWLNPERLPDFDYWQYWRNTEDADVGRFLKLFTELDIAECDRLAALEGAAINEAKIVLATEATALCRGRAAAEAARETARRIFSGEAAASADAAASIQTIEMSRADLETGVPAFRLFVESGLCASNGEARRLVRNGGARVNDRAITDENEAITASDLVDGTLRLSVGRKRSVMVRAG